jgi:hypothetical protein
MSAAPEADDTPQMRDLLAHCRACPACSQALGGERDAEPWPPFIEPCTDGSRLYKDALSSALPQRDGKDAS